MSATTVPHYIIAIADTASDLRRHQRLRFTSSVWVALDQLGYGNDPDRKSLFTKACTELRQRACARRRLRHTASKASTPSVHSSTEPTFVITPDMVESARKLCEERHDDMLDD